MLRLFVGKAKEGAVVAVTGRPVGRPGRLTPSAQGRGGRPRGRPPFSCWNRECVRDPTITSMPVSTVPATGPGLPLLAAPHRTLFFAGLSSLLAASVWWGLHIVARYTGAPLFALVLQPRPDLGPCVAHAVCRLADDVLRLPLHRVSALDERSAVTRNRIRDDRGAVRGWYAALARRHVRRTALLLAGCSRPAPACCSVPAGRCSASCSPHGRSCRMPSSCWSRSACSSSPWRDSPSASARRTTSRCISRCGHRCGAVCCPSSSRSVTA